MRPSSIRVEDERGRVCGPFEVLVQGSLLRLRPRLPRAADLSDGALPPGAALTVRLSGVPSLQALSSEDGAVLSGNRRIGLRTLPAAEVEALAGFPLAAGVVHLAELPDGGVLRFPGRGGVPALVRFSAGLDPRTLAEMPRLSAENPDQEPIRIEIPASLRENAPEEAVVELDFGPWSGRGVLEWPETWTALGGYPIAEAHRRVRVWRGS